MLRKVYGSVVVFIFLLSELVGLTPPLRAEESKNIAVACVACHGENGVSVNPIVPSLAGQPFTLIEDNLLAFRAGQRVCAAENNDQSPSALLALTMCEMIAGFSDKEIAELAGFFERQTFIPAKQNFDSALIDRGMEIHHESACEHCHSAGGKKSNDMAPILAGQWSPYLRRAMTSIRQHSKMGPKAMNAAVNDLAESDVEALIQFYASQQSWNLE